MELERAIEDLEYLRKELDHSVNEIETKKRGCEMIGSLLKQ